MGLGPETTLVEKQHVLYELDENRTRGQARSWGSFEEPMGFQKTMFKPEGRRITYASSSKYRRMYGLARKNVE